MNPIIDSIIKGEVVIKYEDNHWRVTSLGTRFLDWMRQNYKDSEDETWQVYYYSGSMCMIEVIDEKIMTMINLRWQ